jgi:predicted nucleotidyltransferase
LSSKTKTENILIIVKDYLQNQSDVVAAYIFGSVARGCSGPASDVDVAILFAPTLTTKTARFERRLELAVALEELLKRPVEVIDLEGAPPFLQHQIRKDGKLILDKDPQRRKAFEVTARRYYLDMLPFYRKRTAILLEKLGK